VCRVSNILYCHVPGVPWLIIMGSELDDWIYWHCYYNQLQQLTISDCLRLAPFFTGLRVTSLLRYWLGSDLRVGHSSSFRYPLVNTPQLNTQLLNSELSCERQITAHLRKTNLLRLNSVIKGRSPGIHKRRKSAWKPVPQNLKECQQV
jgi:hypothetical protein